MTAQNVKANLMAHVNSDEITREQLAAVELTYPATDTFRPVRHIELVETITKAVAATNMKVIGEQFAIRRDGQMLFGVMKIEHIVHADFVLALGFRHANNRSMSIQMVAGADVFVCDNLCFRGDSIVLRQKHTYGYNLMDQVAAGVARWQQHVHILVNEIEAFRSRGLTVNEAKALILDAFVQKEIMPMRFITNVVKEWEEPRHPEFEPRTMWSLHNAFTEVQKQQPVSTRFQSSQDLGKLFTEYVKR
jgi:Domain of unknown function (DUF932)